MDEKVRQNLVDAGCSEGFIDDYAASERTAPPHT